MRHRLSSAGRWLLERLPAALVWTALVGLAVLGHEFDWRIPSLAQLGKDDEKAEAKPKKNGDEKPAEAPGPPAPEGAFGTSPFDPTLAISHDPKTCEYVKRTIEIKEPDALRRGIFNGVVRERVMSQVLSVNATVEFEPTRIARLAPRAGGVIWRMEKQLGDWVAPGEVVALIDSAEVGKAKAAFLQARVQVEVRRQLRDQLEPGITPNTMILQADAALRDARAQLFNALQTLENLGLPVHLPAIERDSDEQLAHRLRFLGLPPGMAGSLPPNTTANLLPVVAPVLPGGGVRTAGCLVAGSCAFPFQCPVILQREGVTGETVAAQRMLFVIGDVRQMNVFMDVRPEDRGRVALGQAIRYYPDSADEAPVPGRIDWISSEVDPKTRTVRVRARVDNPDGRLKARGFGTARVTLRPAAEVVAVPEEAIQWEGCSHVVFVRLSETAYQVRKVRLGARQDGFVEVLEGVKPGEVIAVLGSHVLKSELFKDRLGEAEE